MTVRNTSSRLISESSSNVAVVSADSLVAEASASELRSTGSYLVVDGSQVVDTVADSVSLTAEVNADKAQLSLSSLMVEAKAEQRPTLVNSLEFILCDEDGVPVAYLSDAFSKSYLCTVGEVGGGSFSIHTKSPQYPLIDLDDIVTVRYAGTNIGHFRIESISESLAAEVLATANVKGRGLLADLEKVLVYPNGTTKERSWTSTTCASILIELMDEAAVRGCTLPAVNFTISDDTDSHPFGESIDFKIDAGTTLLDAIRKLQALADFEVAISPSLELNAYIEQGGYDTEIRIINGRNAQTLDRDVSSTDLATSVLVESASGFSEVDRTTLRRTETYLNATRMTTAPAEDLAGILLDKSEVASEKRKVSIEPLINRPFFDFSLGDYLYVYGVPSAYRIMQIAIGDGSNPYETTCELGLGAKNLAWLQKVELALRNSDSGVSIANSMNLSSKSHAASGSGAVVPHTHVEADITDLSYDAHSIRGRAIQSGTPSDGMTLRYVHGALEWQYAAYLSSLSQMSDVAVTSPTAGDILRYDGTDWGNATLAAAGIAATSHTHTGQVVFAKSGTLAVETGTMRMYNQTGRTLSISKVFAAVGTASSGANINLSVLYDGASAISPAVVISSGANTGGQTLGSTYSWADGHYLTLDITQVGSGTAGGDLTVTIVYS